MTTKFFNHKNGQIAYDVTGEGQLVVCVPQLTLLLWRLSYAMRGCCMDAGLSGLSLEPRF